MRTSCVGRKMRRDVTKRGAKSSTRNGPSSVRKRVSRTLVFVEVALRAGRSPVGAHRRNRPPSSRVEQRREHRVGVEARQAAPHDVRRRPRPAHENWQLPIIARSSEAAGAFDMTGGLLIRGAPSLQTGSDLNKDRTPGTLVPPANAGPAFLRWPIVQTIRLQLRFLLPLTVVVVATAWLVLPLVDRVTLRWFARDLDSRGAVVANACPTRWWRRCGPTGRTSSRSCSTARCRTSACSRSACAARRPHARAHAGLPDRAELLQRAGDQLQARPAAGALPARCTWRCTT